MSSETCPEDVYIFSQQDIDEGPFATCNGSVDNVIVTNASDERLDFPLRKNPIPISNFVIRDNSDLESIMLPNTNLPDGEIVQLEISGSAALKTIGALYLAYVTPVRFNVSDIDHGEIDFRGSSGATDIYLNNSIVVINHLYSMNYLKTTNTVLSLQNVYRIQTMEIEHVYASRSDLGKLEEVQTAQWTNVSAGSFNVSNGYKINGDMVLGPSLSNGLNATDYEGMHFDGVASVGQNLNITENKFVVFDFPDLEQVYGGLYIMGNTDCILNFNKTTKVGSLHARNNTGIVLPGWFPVLEEAGDVFLNGYINPSRSSIIFPNLKTVNNSIRIEPWNSDFDCKSFLSRAKDLGYRSPSCNITADDGPGGSDSDTWPAFGLTGDPTSTITEGQWAGIGTAIAVFVISSCFTVYFVARLIALKKRLRQQQGEQAGQEAAGRSPAANRPEQEVAAKEEDRPHEADGAQVVEAAGREIAPQPRELGNTAVVAEMWAPNSTVAELP